MNRKAILLAGTLCLAALIGGDFSARAAKPDLVIDLAGAYPALPRQTRAEHVEQLRDWLRLALAARVDARRSSMGTTAGALFGDALYRGAHLGEEVEQRTGPARSFLDTEGAVATLHILLPETDTDVPERELLSTEYARAVRARGEPPARVQVHRYALDLRAARARVHDDAPARRSDFERRLGELVTVEVNGVDDLRRLLASEPDLVSAQCQAGKLSITGRAYVAVNAGVKVDDLAVLYSPPPAAYDPKRVDAEAVRALTGLITADAKDAAARDKVYRQFPPLGTALRLRAAAAQRLEQYVEQYDLPRDVILRWLVLDDRAGTSSTQPPPEAFDRDSVDPRVVELLDKIADPDLAEYMGSRFADYPPLGTALAYEDEARRRAGLYQGILTPEVVARWTILERGSEQPIGFGLYRQNSTDEAVRVLREVARSPEALERWIKRSASSRLLPAGAEEKLDAGLLSTARSYLEWYAGALSKLGYWHYPEYFTGDDIASRPRLSGWRNLLMKDVAIEISTAHTYQCGRYDGPVQGTRVGMVFYYTDLLMKLWAFDYESQSPAIDGFLPTAGTDVNAARCLEGKPSAYWMWLGERLEAVTKRSGALEGSLHLDRVVTGTFLHATDDSSQRVIAGDTGYGDRRYIEWFDRHYEEVARYERRYEELNQIMKWTALIRWLATDQPQCFSKLGDLTKEKPERGLHFDQWARQHAGELRYSPDLLPTLVKVPGQETECIPLLRTRRWHYCNYSEYMIVGGVSGPSLATSRSRPAATKPPPIPSLDPSFRISEGQGTPRASRIYGHLDGVDRRVEQSGRRVLVEEVVHTRTRAASPQALKRFERLQREARIEGSDGSMVLEQRFAGRPDGALRLEPKDAAWRELRIHAKASSEEQAGRAVSALERRIAQGDPPVVPDGTEGWRALFEEAGVEADLYVNQRRGGQMSFAVPEMPDVYVEVARGPPDVDQIKAGWRMMIREGTKEGDGHLQFRVQRASSGGKGPPLGTYTDHISVDEAALAQDVAMAQRSLDASDWVQLRRGIEKLTSAAARAPPSQVDLTFQRLLSRSLALEARGETKTAAELRDMALALMRKTEAEFAVPPIKFAQLDEQHVALRGAAKPTELVQLVSDDGRLSVDAVLARDGLIEARVPGRPMPVELAEVLLPRPGDSFPRAEAFFARIPTRPDGEAFGVRTRGGVLRNVTQARARRPAKAAPGITIESAIGSYTRNRYQAKEITWTELLTETDRTDVTAILVVQCDADHDGHVTAEEWLTCRCDVDLDGRVGPEEASCRKEAIDWIVSTRSRTPALPEWVSRRCHGKEHTASTGLCYAALASRVEQEAAAAPARPAARN